MSSRPDDEPSALFRPVARVESSRALEVVEIVDYTNYSANKRYTFTLQNGEVVLIERAVEKRTGWRGPWLTYPGRVPESVREALLVELEADCWDGVLTDKPDHEWLEGPL